MTLYTRKRFPVKFLAYYNFFVWWLNDKLGNFHIISSPPFRIHMSSPVAFLIWGSDHAHLPKHSKKQIPVLSLRSLCFLGGIFLYILSGCERNCLFRFIVCYWSICAVVRKPAIGIYTEKVSFASLFSQINTVINSVIFWAFSNPILSEWHPDG